MKTISLACFACLISLAGCMTPDEPTASESATPGSELRTYSCTPGAQLCDWGCGYVGGPSTDDCIVQCNSAGTGYFLVENCGWAQNFPYSSSCLESQPPVCKWN
ncbi:MAG: hypothetical protein R3B48_00095 [Kofleriaceae bacterium]